MGSNRVGHVWVTSLGHRGDNPKGNQPWIFIGRTGAEAEVPILWPPDEKIWLIGKDLDPGKDWGQEEKALTEDEMIGWHHWLNGHEFEQTQGDSKGQRSLAHWSSWGHRVGHNLSTEQQQHYSTGLSCPLNRNFTHIQFCSTLFGHFGNTGMLSYTDLLNVWLRHFIT